MPFSPEERKALLAAPLVGKKTVGYFEAIGMDSFAVLKEQDAAFVCSLIAHESGLPGWATHGMALRCVSNAIDAAKRGLQCHGR